jgi:hypothetical protein
LLIGMIVLDDTCFGPEVPCEQQEICP